MLKKVLIVEDSTLQAKMYRGVFAIYPQCELLFSLNGLEALDKLATERVDLILLDINMPKMDGLTFLDAKREQGYLDIPVVIVSTEGKDEDILRALKAGAVAYIKKPWKLANIREVVERVTADKGA